MNDPVDMAIAIGVVIAWFVTCRMVFGEMWSALVAIWVPIGVGIIYGVVQVCRGQLDWWGNPKPGFEKPNPQAYLEYLQTRQARPPTDRQLEFIDELIEEREADDWIGVCKPATLEEASELIGALLELPYRDDD